LKFGAGAKLELRRVGFTDPAADAVGKAATETTGALALAAGLFVRNTSELAFEN
jgi:hypothetical protein